MLARASVIARRRGTVNACRRRVPQRSLTEAGKDSKPNLQVSKAEVLSAEQSKAKILASRQARKAGRQGSATVGTDSGGGTRVTGTVASEHRGGRGLLIATAGLATMGGIWLYKEGDVGQVLRGTVIDSALAWLTTQIAEIARPFTEPSREKLLPNWPPPQAPPGTPCPPTLVLDLEGTLVASEWNRKNGWRTAKRPGVDAFLKEMHQLYEIVVFTDSSGGLADQVITSLDPNGYIMYRLYRDATKFEGGKHIKDLSCMNRPIEHIVMVDDNPDSVSLQPENSILVKKYSIGDGEGLQDDNVLPELAPFLVALATQGVSDFRNVLKPHVGKDSSSVTSAYSAKVNAVREEENRSRNRGLGGLVRRRAAGAGGSGDGVSETPPARAKSSGLSSKDLVGEAPASLPPGSVGAGGVPGGVPTPVPVEKAKRGSFWKSYQERKTEVEEETMRKNEVWQRVMMKKQEERERREEEERARVRAQAKARH